jgi:hypothetical protein
LAKVCRKKKKDSSTPEQANFVEEEGDREYGMFHVGLGQTRPLYATVTVNGNPLSMEVDTGASVSITSLETFKTIQNGESTLQLERVSQSESLARPRSKWHTMVKPLPLPLPLIVTEGKGPTLLGRNWLEALRLH